MSRKAIKELQKLSPLHKMFSGKKLVKYQLPAQRAAKVKAHFL